MASAKETTDGVKGHERYQREYGTRGIVRMEVYQELVQPIITGLKIDPALSPEQKAIAVKEVPRLFKEQLRQFQMGILKSAKGFAQTFVIPVPIVPGKPSASPAGGLLV